MERAQSRDLGRVGPVPFRPRGLEDRRQLLERGVGDERSQAVAHQADADRVVAVEVGAKLRLRVVDMEAAEPVEPDLLVEIGDCGVEDDLVRHVDARDEPVTGVETQP